jgi:hypothetical protein
VVQRERNAVVRDRVPRPRLEQGEEPCAVIVADKESPAPGRRAGLVAQRPAVGTASATITPTPT